MFGAVSRVVENSFFYIRGVCICILHSFVITCSLVENTSVFLMESLLPYAFPPLLPDTYNRYIILICT